MRQYATLHPTRWKVFVVLVAITASLFSKFPAYTDTYAKFPGNMMGLSATPHGRTLQWWLEHPFQPVPVERFFSAEVLRDPMMAGAASHCDKLTFRAFLPLLNQIIRAGIWTLIVANHLAAILAFLLIYQICARVMSDPLCAAFVVWTYAVTWAGAWGFNDMMFGDAVAIALLLGAMLVRPWWLVSVVLLAAGFTDERAFTAAPAVVLFRYWTSAPPFSARGGKVPWSRLGAAGVPLLVAFVVYGAGRLYATYRLHLHAGTSMMASPEIVLYHFYVSYPGKLFKVFEFLWGFPALMLLHFVRSGADDRRDALLYLACSAIAAAPAFLIWDVDRSLCYLLPAVLGAVCFLPAEAVAKSRTALVAGVASLLWLEPNGSVLRYFVFG